MFLELKQNKILFLSFENLDDFYCKKLTKGSNRPPHHPHVTKWKRSRVFKNKNRFFAHILCKLHSKLNFLKFEIIMELHAIIKYNTEKSCLPFTQLPSIENKVLQNYSSTTQSGYWQQYYQDTEFFYHGYHSCCFSKSVFISVLSLLLP